MTDALKEFLTPRSGSSAPSLEVSSSPHLYIDFMTPLCSRAFAYAHLYSIAYDGSIEITFTDHTVVLEGSNLNRLYLAIQQHAIDRIVSVDELHAEAARTPLYVSSIDIRKNEDTR